MTSVPLRASAGMEVVVAANGQEARSLIALITCWRPDWAVTIRIGTGEPVSRIERVKSRPDMPGHLPIDHHGVELDLSNSERASCPLAASTTSMPADSRQGHADHCAANGVIVSNQDFHGLIPDDLGMDRGGNFAGIRIQTSLCHNRRPGAKKRKILRQHDLCMTCRNPPAWMDGYLGL